MIGLLRGRFVSVALCSLCLLLTVVGCGNETTSDAPKKAAVAKKPTAPQAATKFGIESFCPEICRRTTVLGCRATGSCSAMCQRAFADMVCPDLLRPAMECALAQPLSDWMCSADGFGAVVDGPCAREQAAYDACLAAIK